MKTLGFCQFEIIINVLVSSFWFIWIPMLWVYAHFKSVNSYSAGIEFSQILTSKVDPRIIWILTHLKLCLADAIHNFKWVKIIVRVNTNTDKSIWVC